jgi:hypothetical protein
MSSNSAKKQPPPPILTSPTTVSIPFNSTDGFLTNEEVTAHVDDTLKFENQTMGLGSMSIYILTSSGVSQSGTLLGSSNQQISVTNGQYQERTVLATGTYLLSRNCPPPTVDPNDPAGGSTITIIVTS